MQSIHKLTAGDGYSYLTRQVAALDATDLGHTGLADYYSRRGESPGVWLGSALADVDMQAGEPVTADQMAALFAEGLHPNADAIQARMLRDGPTRGDAAAARAAASLGAPFKIMDTAPAFRIEVARRCAAANAALGMPADWPLAAAERARIRTDVGREMFTAEYGRPPGNPRELSSFIARNSRQSTSAVAGFDLTFSPVKSVSALWAIAPQPVAEQIRAAHDAAVRDTLAWLEREAIYTRGGRNGVQQLDTTGMLAAAFTHRDSRAGDPDLHTHVAVSSKVRVRHADGTPGRWLALDGRILFKATVSSSERYNTRLEAELHRRLGLAFTERSDAAAAAAAGRRPVREIGGVPERLTEVWSTRRAAIDARRAQLATLFQTDHGRPPTPIEAVKLAQQATLETRDAKHAPRSEARQRRQWHAEAAAVLGGEQALARLVRSLTAPRQWTPSDTAAPLPDATVKQIVAETKRVVEGHRSTWQVWHVRAEAERQARAKAPVGADVDALVEHVVATVLHPHHSMPLGQPDPVQVPDVLRRADGTSVYEVAGSRLYTSAAVLADEAFIVQAATQLGGRVARAGDVDVALLESLANGVSLNTAQAHLVRQLATSGARLQLAIAPAGSGKTTAMSALTRAWTHSDGTVIGLAPSAVAASVLGEQTGAGADTLAKLTHALATGYLPDWANKVDDKTLLIIDEAGMAATRDLADTIRFALGRGASVRLVGDDRQLASVAAGGVLRDIKATVGAVTLSELIRFRDQAEGAASLALRAGDTAALGFYLDSDRIHVGDLATVTDTTYTAWASDRASGLDAIMLAPTRKLATALNMRARTDRLARLDRPPRRQVSLAGGAGVSDGDLVITRRNKRQLRTSPTDWVKNGDRWTVRTVHRDGRLGVVHTHTGRRITLPADYVAAHVQLGYAATVHGGQGVTADTSHTVVTGAESRQQLYVALTRGRAANHVHLVTALDGDEHSVITPAATHPLTAVNILEQVLARDEAQVSATTTREQLADPGADLAAADARYRDSLAVAAVHIQGPAWTQHVDAAVEAQVPGITDSPAWPTLRGHLALLAADGHDPISAFTTALTSREFDTAADVAAILDWRLDPTHTRSRTPGPLPWLAGIPNPLRTDPYWGDYLLARQQHVLDAARAVRDSSSQLAASSCPGWARQLLTLEHQMLLADLAVFRAAHAVPDDDTRPTGPKQLAAADRRAQQDLDQRIAAAIDTSYRTAWTPLATQIGLTPHTDPHWPALIETLTALSRAGADAPTLLRAAATEAPLPDQYQAAALIWRIARHTTPAVLTRDPHTAPADPLRPAWLAHLHTALTPAAAEELLHDTRWPAVVTAVNRAIDHGIPLADVLRTPIGPDGTPVPQHALADALIYRAITLTDPLPPDPDLEPADAPPQDLHMLTVTLHHHTPINLPQPDIEADPNFDDHLRTADNPAPPPVETIPASQATLTAEELDLELFHAAEHRQWIPPWQPTDTQQQRLEARAADAERSPVTPERIADLNAQARAFYQHTYRGSWAQAYLAERLRVDLTGDPCVQPGYAPAQWAALTSHLRRRGATDTELLAAGLAKRTTTGRLIDTFRDRLVLPIHHHGHIAGFTGRRNPATDTLDPASDATAKAGPKYLNTSDTILYAKSEQLYGAGEYPDLLAAGATPVLVEGPLDALAVTHASPGYVGVAPLGTALTDTQADTLIPHLHTSTGVIVATDGDVAGQLAAERDYWMLTARGGEPRHVIFPPGQDPASVLAADGPDALRHRVTHAQPLARALIDERLAHLPPSEALPAALAVVAAADAHHWVDHTGDIARRLHLPTDVALTHLLAHITNWDRDRHAAADQLAHGAHARTRLTAIATLTPAQRWAPLARQIHPGLIAADNWAALADTIDNAYHHGADIPTLLPALAAQRPLSPERPATDLTYRLLASTDLPIDPTPPPQTRAVPTPTPPPSPHPTTPRHQPDTAPRI